MRKAPVVAAFALLVATGPDAQSRQQPIVSSATAILVDVVVRDRHGRPITDLTADDFRVFEDGVAQTVDSFTRVSRGTGIGIGVAFRSPSPPIAVAPSARPEGGVPQSAQDEATTAFVFDHLTAESLRLAQRATLDYVPKNGDSAVKVGVFATDPGVRVLQRYTTDRALVRRAVERVVPSGTSAADQQADRAEELMTRRRELQRQGDAAASQATGNSAVVAQNASGFGIRDAELRLIQSELNMLRSFDSLDRDVRGHDTTLALLAVIESLSFHPGRKTIVFFSEGLPASPVLSTRLDRVIEAANRSNITAYVVDAHGLRAASTTTAMRKEMQDFVDERFRQLASASDHTNQPLTMGFERVEDTMRLDSRTGLARLAEDTGGFLVDGTNNLRDAFRRIDEDSQFHYLLTYSPTDTNFDGKFRRIDVRATRPGARTFSRRGYRAVRMPAGARAGSHETAALALLAVSPLPNAFPITATGFSFPHPLRAGLTPVVVRVGTGALRFDVDARRGVYAGQLTVLVRLRDERGLEVDKVSQQYLLAGDAADLAAAKSGEILFYREIDLPPGVYTMEAMAFDAIAQRGSVRVSTLTVPPADPSVLALSSIVVVRRAEEVSDAPSDAATTAPFFVGRTLLYPNLGEPILKSEARELPFFFTVYGNVAGVKASVQLLRHGTPIADAPLPLPPATGTRVQHVGRLPIDMLPPGTYELRIRVSDGRHDATRAVYFTLRES